MTRAHPAIVVWAAGTVLAGLAGAGGAGAQQTPAASEAGSTPHAAPQEASSLLAWIGGLGAPTPPAATQRLLDLLAAGQTDEVTDAALAALASSADPRADPTLREFTGHRRRSARLAAYGALAKRPGPAADALLAGGLRDSDSLVRALCARALGERGARAQAQWLLLALERGVVEAAGPVGLLAPEDALPRMHALLERTSIAPLLAGYSRWLSRRDISERAKLDILTRLENVAGPSVAAFLDELLQGGGLPAGRVRTMAEQVHRHVAGAQK